MNLVSVCYVIYEQGVLGINVMPAIILTKPETLEGRDRVATFPHPFAARQFIRNHSPKDTPVQILKAA